MTQNSFLKRQAERRYREAMKAKADDLASKLDTRQTFRSDDSFEKEDGIFARMEAITTAREHYTSIIEEEVEDIASVFGPHPSETEGQEPKRVHKLRVPRRK